MRISEIFRLVLINLSQNKFKAVLTSIGIIVGSATIMMVIAIGTGGKEEVAAQFKNLNAGAIDISYEGGNSRNFGGGGGNSGDGIFGFDGTPFAGFSGGPSGGGAPSGGPSGGGAPSGGPSGGDSGPFGGGDPFGMMMFGGMFGGFDDSNRINQENITLSMDDVENLETFVPDINAVTISYSTNTAVEGGDLESSTNYTVAGVLDNYAGISNLTVAVGDFLLEENNENKEKVCVLGYSVAKEIFGSVEGAYDGIIYIDDRPYSVVGVLDELGSVASGISPDTAIFIPYNTGIKYLTGDDVNATITVISNDVNRVDQVIANIQTVLADMYPNAEFTISDAGSKMEAASASNTTLTMMLIAMAAIVFIVGGIGIMNVLFVSVKERTNEIGILKALGCSRRDILLEFLIEAMCVSLIGAILGVLVSLGLSPVVQYLGVSVSLSVSGAVYALVFGVLTGTVFGFYPAYKASILIPVQALNAE